MERGWEGLIRGQPRMGAFNTYELFNMSEPFELSITGMERSRYENKEEQWCR